MVTRYKFQMSCLGFGFLIMASTIARAMPEDCLDLTAPATYFGATGLVCLQKVLVADQGDVEVYQAALQWLGADNPNRFKLISATHDATAESSDSPIYSATSGLLTLPKVDVPSLFGTDRYQVNLAVVQDPEDPAAIFFELTKVALYHYPEYDASTHWKPYGLLQAEERRAVDLLGSSLPYAQLSDAIYDFDNTVVDSWLLTETISKSSGMQAGLYSHQDTGELVVVFRGTESCDFPCSLSETKAYLLDVAADTALTLGFANDQFKHAVNFVQDVVNRYPGRTITVTGHSLGGGLAQAAGSVLGLETFAFNASPVPDGFYNDYDLTLTDEELREIIHVIADIHDPVSNTDETGKFYLNADHITSLIQFDFDRREIIPDELSDLYDLRFDRHSITKFFNHATSLITTYQQGW